MHNTFQFIIGREPVSVSNKTLHIKITNHLSLSYDSNLPVSEFQDKENNTWWLIGWCFQTNHSYPDLKSQITSNSTTDIRDASKDWVGRWVLTNGDALYMDAGGSLGCFYTTIKNETWVSSSVTLLSKTTTKTASKIVHGQGLDFYPGPYTIYKGVYRLLPSQTLKALDNKIEITHNPLSKVSFSNYEDTLDFIEKRLITTIQNIAKKENDIWLPLTAGYDSRLILSAVYKSGVNVTTYTFDKPFTYMSKADKKIPQLLARDLGFKHVIIKKGDYSQKRLNDFDTHSGDMTQGIDNKYYALGQWEKIPESAFILRGGMFELSRCYYYGKLDAHQEQARESIYKAFKFNSYHKNSIAHINSISDWVEWTKNNSDTSVDWRDQFYHDQRIGSWLSSIEQGLDLTGRRRVHVANCHNLFTALLALPLNIRKSGKHYTDLINKMSPNLLKYPINPRDPFLIRGARRIIRKIKTL